MAKKTKSNFGKGFKKEQERKGIFTPIDAGRYKLRCVKSEDVKNSKQTGNNYKTEWKVLGGEFKNRTIKLSYSYDNPSKQAEEIANAAIASMCDAAGVKFEKFTDPKMMLKKKIQAEVIIKPPEKGSQYGPQNDIAVFLDIDESMPETEGKKKDKKKGKKPF